jgi:hypothetical protein
MSRLADLHEALVEITKYCCPDMRTPGKQGVFGGVHGHGLDNACVPHLRLSDASMTPNMVEGYNLFLTIVKGGSGLLNVNLADLIAIARAADPEKIKALEGQ